ncbi:hypothetical protein pb186bvf_010557 [Paramecium bursaria]
MNTLLSGIVVSKIEDIIIDKCMVLMYDNEITRQAPRYAKNQFLNQLKSVFKIYTQESDNNINNVNEELEQQVFKPNFDTFQSLSLKIIEQTQQVQIQDPQFIKKISSIKLPNEDSKEMSVLSHNNGSNIPDSASQLFLQNDESAHRTVYRVINRNQKLEKEKLKTHIKQITQHVFIDKIDTQEFKRKIEQMCEEVKKSDTLYRKPQRALKPLENSRQNTRQESSKQRSVSKEKSLSQTKTIINPYQRNRTQSFNTTVKHDILMTNGYPSYSSLKRKQS